MEERWIAPICPQCDDLKKTFIVWFRFDQDGHLWFLWACIRCDTNPDGTYNYHTTLYELDQIVADITTAGEEAEGEVKALGKTFARYEKMFHTRRKS